MAKFKPYVFDPIKELELDIPRSKRREALETAASFLKEAVLEYIGDAKSPVAGGKWIRRLEPSYREKKIEESGVDFANLELTGDLLDSLDVDVNKGKVIFDVSEDEYRVAEGHISGIYGENSKKVKPRQFLPQGKETFKKSILEDLKALLQEYEDGED
jgi:hypothetical protein